MNLGSLSKLWEYNLSFKSEEQLLELLIRTDFPGVLAIEELHFLMVFIWYDFSQDFIEISSAQGSYFIVGVVAVLL